MPEFPALGLVFAALAVIFLGLSLPHYLRGDGKLTPARKTWLRVGVIFAVVSIGLVLMWILGP